MKCILAPSILSADFSKISEEIKILEKGGADMIHLDVMDGHFVPNITFGPKFVNDVNKITELPLDVHLMIKNPELYIKAFAESGADWISVHYEACDHLNKIIVQIKEYGCSAGVALNPATSINVLDEILGYADYVLLMSVNPGFGGQKFIPESLDKARRLRSLLDRVNPSAMIEMDGGIGPDNINEIKNSGVDVFVTGNSVFSSPDPSATLRRLKQAIS